jgi:uncharacterized protein
MLLYLDASALVKHYIVERFSVLVDEAIGNAEIAGTTILSRAEVSAALGKAVRVGALNRKEAFRTLKAFRKDWESLARVQASESVVSRADALAWSLSLRGYDAVHLASALIWRETVNEPVTFATFDVNLWNAAQTEGLELLPDDLPALSKR